MALRSKDVELLRLPLLDDADQVGSVRQVPVVQLEADPRFVRITMQVIDPIRIERRCPTLDVVNLVAFAEPELGQVRAVLPGDACNQCLVNQDGSPFNTPRRIITSSSTSTSILVRRKQSSASSGRHTTGSFSLKDVFNTMGTPVSSRKALMRV